MNQQQGENAVLITALVVSGMYGYRYFTEGGKESAENPSYVQKYKDWYGFGPVLPLGTWIPAAGVTFLSLSILATASPKVGGTASVLVGTTAFFGNFLAVNKDLSGAKSVKNPGGSGVTGKEPLLKGEKTLPNLGLEKMEPAGSLNHPPATQGVQGLV